MGTKSVSPISAVQNRACRIFLGLGRYAPIAAVNGDMGWPAPEHRQWMCITRKWCRLITLDESLITKIVFRAHLDRCNPRYKTWCHRVKMFYHQLELDICRGHRLAVRATLNTVNTTLQVYFEKLLERKAKRRICKGRSRCWWKQIKNVYAI